MVTASVSAQADPQPNAGGPWSRNASVAAATWALFVGLAMVMMGNGLNGAVLGVRSEAEGFGLAVTGVVMAAHFGGYFAGAFFSEYALVRVGHIRVFSALASSASAVVLLQALSAEPWLWICTRFVFGGSMAGLYVVVESWLNNLSTNETRGRILSVYMIVSMGGIGAGQLLLNVNDTTGFTLFILVSVLVSLSLVPVTLSAQSTPTPVTFSSFGLRQLAHRAPVGVALSFWTGASAGALMGMGAVYAATEGMRPGVISAFLFAPTLGGILFQWPVGWASDRLPRRSVILVVALFGVLAPLGALMEGPATIGGLAWMAVLGGAVYSEYSLAIAYTNDWLEPREVLGASATLVRVNGSGAIVGPLVAAVLMAAFGSSLFFWSISGCFGAAGLFVLYRMVVRDPLPLDRQQDFVAFPARASGAAAAMLPSRGSGEGSAPADAGAGIAPNP